MSRQVTWDEFHAGLKGHKIRIFSEGAPRRWEYWSVTGDYATHKVGEIVFRTHPYRMAHFLEEIPVIVQETPAVENKNVGFAQYLREKFKATPSAVTLATAYIHWCTNCDVSRMEPVGPTSGILTVEYEGAETQVRYEWLDEGHMKFDVVRD